MAPRIDSKSSATSRARNEPTAKVWVVQQLLVSRSPRSHSLTVEKKKKLALTFFPFPSLTLRDGFQMPGDLVPTLALWTATTFRQLKGSPLRALPTTPPCRVHPCSRLFHRPPVSPSALPALPDLNSSARQQVPAYPCIFVPSYPSTDARPGPFFPPPHS